MANQMTQIALAELSSPARNNFFYGKLMGVQQFQLEQAYFLRQRWLLNRLGLGSGVLCGLEVVPTEDGQKLWLRPGVALDGLGREIVVPSAYCIENPRQPTDDCGRPAGDPIAGAGVVTLLLCYHECPVEPVPVMVNACEPRQDCAPGTIRERYLLRVVAGEPASRPAGLSQEQCDAIFPEGAPGPDFDRRVAACETLSAACAPPAEDCVVLATVMLPASAGEALSVDQCALRPNVYSNTRLFDLIMCLAEQVSACCARLMLRYVSGDAQQAAPAAELSDPLVVEVVDHEGQPVAGQTVSFAVRGGGGALAPASVTSDASGRAETRWTLGPQAGLNTMAASIAGAPELPLFALAVAEQETPATLPPVIRQTFPAPAEILGPNTPELTRWLERPLIAITFDRGMEQTQLQGPERVAAWLRVHQLVQGDQTAVTPVRLELIDLTEDFPNRSGFTAVYRLVLEEPRRPARYLVQVRADAGNITDTSTPPLTLDAEFAGTRLSANVLNRIWQAQQPEQMAATVWNGLLDTGNSLPQSGDGAEGGRFHAWFEIAGQA